MDSTQGGQEFPKTNVDLSLASFDDIYAELCRRYDHCVFAGVIHKSVPQYFVTRKYKGYRLMCLGLVSNLESLLYNVKLQTDKVSFFSTPIPFA